MQEQSIPHTLTTENLENNREVKVEKGLLFSLYHHKYTHITLLYNWFLYSSIPLLFFYLVVHGDWI